MSISLLSRRFAACAQSGANGEKFTRKIGAFRDQCVSENETVHSQGSHCYEKAANCVFPAAIHVVTSQVNGAGPENS